MTHTHNPLKIRTRFAPSPTGFMHVGSVRTALFAWLLARQNDGAFILRLEDTDQKREVAGSAEHIATTLNALGLHYTEGPGVGGPHGPYKQSERLAIYKEWAQKLIDSGRAYADPYTTDQLTEFRDAAKAEKRAFLYRDHRPENPLEWDGSTPLRFKSEPQSYQWHDEVMGNLSTGPEVVDDFILIKSDGFPTYNFAHIVDDAEMQISHVIRGQEFISSMANYLNLYDALGIEWPIFATMPHIMAEAGNKKLGKRDGAKDILEYLKEGYLHETMLNFIASLGWNDGTEQELFSVEELIEKFSLGRVHHSGARFDVKRLEWMNGQHIRQLSLEDLAQRVEAFWPPSAATAYSDEKHRILSLVQDRLKTLADLSVLTDYFFSEPAPDWSMVDENKQLGKLERPQHKAILHEAIAALEKTEFTPDDIQATLNQLLESTGQKPVIVFSLIRLAVSWAPFSPALNDTLAVLCKETVLQRLRTALV